MVRSGGVRLGLVLTAAFVAWLVQVALTSGGVLDAPSSPPPSSWRPSAYLGFGFLAFIAPLTSGGGNEVVPSDQLVAFPVRTSTQFLGGLLLAPLNLVWVVQLLALAAFTAFLTLDTSLWRGGMTTAAYVACITVLGQAAAWLVVGLGRPGQAGARRRRPLAAGRAAVATVQTGQGARCWPQPHPQRRACRHGQRHGALGGDERRAAGARGRRRAPGQPAVRWALRRPGDAGSPPAPTRSVGEPRGEGSCASWSPWTVPASGGLRRCAAAGLVLAVLPGLLAAAGGVPWESLDRPAGPGRGRRGLLFGINVFCLDGSGAVWLASLPQSPEAGPVRQGARPDRDGAGRGQPVRRGGLAAQPRQPDVRPS
jgi:hypothetical protein